MSNKLTELQQEYLAVIGIIVSLSVIAVMFQSVTWLFLFALSGAVFSCIALAIVIASQGVHTLKPVTTKK